MNQWMKISRFLNETSQYFSDSVEFFMVNISCFPFMNYSATHLLVFTTWAHEAYHNILPHSKLVIRREKWEKIDKSFHNERAQLGKSREENLIFTWKTEKISLTLTPSFRRIGKSLQRSKSWPRHEKLCLVSFFRDRLTQCKTELVSIVSLSYTRSKLHWNT